MLNNLLANAPIASGVSGVALLDAVPGEGTLSLILKAVIAIASIVTTIMSHKKLTARVDDAKVNYDTTVSKTQK